MNKDQLNSPSGRWKAPPGKQQMDFYRRNCFSYLFVFCMLLLSTLNAAAQQPQIPTLQVCNRTSVDADGEIEIIARADSSHTGRVEVHVGVNCDPDQGVFYPVNSGSRLILNLAESPTGQISVTNFEQVTTTGRITPTAYMNGRCDALEIRGCRFWLMVVDNRNDPSGTPDIVGFVVFDGTGQRVAYGTGPLVDGNAYVAPNSF